MTYIVDPDVWVFRGVMADMLRAYEVLRDDRVPR